MLIVLSNPSLFGKGKIIDMTSRVLFEGFYDSAYSLDIPVTQIKPGVYFLYVNDTVKKIVVAE
jgi:hypothetical protein